ncbi:MAG: hypothetical protein AAFV53_42250 [Myxococcota bacterium]
MGERRSFREVQLSYRLVGPWGHRSPTTQEKRWFFEVPAALDTELGWAELLHRIFYDANHTLRSQQPDDLSWLDLDAFAVSAVDTAGALRWDGATGQAALLAALPWHVIGAVWEYATSYWVDDDGRYDALDPTSFSELVAYRALERGEDEATVVRFISRLFSGVTDPRAKIYDNRATRMKNIVCVRPTRLYRKPVGARPFVSGPVSG